MKHHPTELDDDQLLDQCARKAVRRSGPGGQHRNKVETGIVLQHEPTGVEAEASEQRSQAANLKQALHRLRVSLALDVRASGVRSPTELWRQRCPQGRLQVNPRHADFPALLAEALDVITDCDFDVARAADRLQCSRSQLVKLLRIEYRALQLVNHARQQRSLHPLR